MRAVILCILILFFTTCSCTAKTMQDGLDYYKVGNYHRAEEIFRALVRKYPTDYKAQYLLAVTLVNLQKYDEAKQLYRNITFNSANERLVNLSKTGLGNLGDSAYASVQGYQSTKAILNVNIKGGVIIVNDVVLNNRISAKFIFDTGASYTTISREIAQKLGISTRGAKSLKIMTGSGYINAPLVKIPEIELKGLVVKNVEAIVTDLPVHSTDNDYGLAGLLGLSFLEKFRVTVDRANNQITLEKN